MGLTRRCAAMLGRSAFARRGLSTRCTALLENTTCASLAQWSLPSKCGGHFASAVCNSLLSRRGFASDGLPPHSELGMPALSPTMSQGNIAEWKKKEGDEIMAGDVLCEVETDKATMDWEAQDEGFLAKIILPAGSKDIPVGTPVAVVVEDAEHVAAFKDYEPGSGGGSEGAPAEAALSQEPEQAQEEEPEVEEASAEPSGDFPPHTVMGLPALSPTMSQGNIAAWKKGEGDEVAAGDSIAEVETDKATMDWESQDDGYIAKLLVPDGAKDIAVGDPVAVFVEDKDSVSAFANFTAADASGAPKKAPKKEKPPPPKKEIPPAAPPKEPKQEAKAAAQAPKPSGGRVIASPYARKLAAEAGVDLSQAQGSGPGGRIVASDVQKLIESSGGKGAPEQASAGAKVGKPHAAGPGAESDFTDVPNSQIRKITAQRLLQSKTTVPHYYLTVDLRADKLMALRASLNEALAPSGGKLSLNDFIIKACALALRKVPDVNASWMGDFIRKYHNIDISVAVQTPSGLMVPIVADADALGLAEIASTVKDLATRAKVGKLKPQEFTGGTFSVSNLGMYGIDEFAAIINPPQAAILAVGTTQRRVIALPGGGFGEAVVMACTLSCDHRVVDGALGAQWLQAFRGYIEDPATMLL